MGHVSDPQLSETVTIEQPTAFLTEGGLDLDLDYAWLPQCPQYTAETVLGDKCSVSVMEPATYHIETGLSSSGVVPCVESISSSTEPGLNVATVCSTEVCTDEKHTELYHEISSVIDQTEIPPTDMVDDTHFYSLLFQEDIESCADNKHGKHRQQFQHSEQENRQFNEKYLECWSHM